MEFMRAAILFFITILLSNSVYSQRTDTTLANVRNEIKILSNNVEETRKGQLNYSIEKNLLKEAYSSNLQTIQMVLTIVLSIFSVLGFLGLRGVFNLKTDYDKELGKLKEIKGEFELKLKELSQAQESLKLQLRDVNNKNEEQNKKIRLIELKEKVNISFLQKNYKIALEYVDALIEGNEEDLDLKYYKANILLKLKRYREAIDIYQELIMKKYNVIEISVDLSVCLLLEKRIDDYEDLFKINGNSMYAKFRNHTYFFEAFKLFMKNDLNELNNMIDKYISEFDISQFDNTKSWDPVQIENYLSSQPDSPHKNLISKFLSHLFRGDSITELEESRREALLISNAMN